MNSEKINIIVGCVMTSHLEYEEKKSLIEFMRKLERKNEVEDILIDIMTAFNPKTKNMKLDESQQRALIKVANLYQEMTGKDSFPTTQID